jgi:pimeloyl-ACP methyl ester carboxylesterase/uncharacterized RmlC-like cupin family protein
MHVITRSLLSILSGIVLAATGPTLLVAQSRVEVESRFADVNGVRMHYLFAGSGDPVILLHGYAQNSHMWRPLMAALAGTHTVIAPDLRGFGQSSKPDAGYDKRTLAQDVQALARTLGHRRVRIVGHDIGLMVAYAYAAQYPADVERIALMDAFLPGVGDWQSVWLLRDLWHFHFYGVTPLALVAGRERIYFEHFWNDFAADPTRSIPEADRKSYAAAYAQPGAMRAGFEVFRAFERDAKEFAQLAQTRLSMPMLVLTGEKASGQFLIEQGRLVADNVEGVVVKGSGHWLMEEAPDQVIPKLVSFLSEPRNKGIPATSPEHGQAHSTGRRLTASEIADMARGGAGVGTSGVAGIETTVLSGNPARAGLYTIRLSVPANTRIEAHTHRDDRTATVIAGTWYLGYGSRHEESALKALPPGSFYTEAPGQSHFAQTRSEPVVVYITGYGPSDTTFVGKPAAPREN